MPLYQVITTEGLMSDDQRQEIATEIARIHTSNTGAPALFVNVVFTDHPQGRIFTAGKPSTMSMILGSIRAGRDIELRQKMLRELSQMWVRITGAAESDVLLAIQEADPRAAMEAGLFFPAAGQEALWFEENHDKLAALGLLTR